MSTTERKTTLLILLSCLVVASWADDSPKLSYLQCVSDSSLSNKKSQKVLVFPINQTDLEEPGPSACAKNCLQIKPTYYYFFVHVPAKGSPNFINKLVCGCGNIDSLRSVPEQRDSLCNLPCPLGNNHTIDAVQLTGGDSQVVEDQSWNPDKPNANSQNKIRLLTVPGGVAGLKNPGQIRRKPAASHRTCGNGHGFLSVYEFLQNNAWTNNNQFPSLLFLLALIFWWT